MNGILNHQVDVNRFDVIRFNAASNPVRDASRTKDHACRRSGSDSNEPPGSLEASDTPSLRPPKWILNTTGVSEETHLAAMQNAAPLMDAAFVFCCPFVASGPHWHGPQAPMSRPRSAASTVPSSLRSHCGSMVPQDPMRMPRSAALTASSRQFTSARQSSHQES